MRTLTTALIATVVAVTALLAAGCGGGGSSSGSTASPAFSAAELSSLPRANWITNGGSISNERYSPLAQINTGNVAGLKGLWHIHLGSGIAGKYSRRGAAPRLQERHLRRHRRRSDVVAVDAKTGARKWTYRANLNQKIATICCGWTAAASLLATGRSTSASSTAELVALDQDTGRVTWSTQVASFEQGYTITNAPLYYDGASTRVSPAVNSASAAD